MAKLYYHFIDILIVFILPIIGLANPNPEESTDEVYLDRGNYQLSISDGLISLDSQGADLQDILSTLSKQSGIEIKSYEDIHRPVSVSFRMFTFEKAINHLVSNTGIIYVKENSGHPFKISTVLIAESMADEQDNRDPESSGSDFEDNGIESLPHFGSIAGPINAESIQKNDEFNNRIKVVADQLIVRFSDGLSKQDITAIVSKYGALIKEHIEPLNQYVIQLPEGVSVNQAHRWFKRQSEIMQAEPNFLIPVHTNPNDPFFPQQWALNNTGQSGGALQADIDILNAWGLEIGSQGIVIAVVDTGVDYRHEDLAPNIWRNPGEISGNGIDDDNNGYVDDIRGWDFVNSDSGFEGEDYAVRDNDPMDTHGHGTLVAGVAAATGNNGRGITGVTWRSKIMPVRAGFKTAGGSGLLLSVDAALAIIYAAQNGAHIINLSWGAKYRSAIIEDAINFAAEHGVLILASAGNQNTSLPLYPGALDNDAVMTVGATDHNDNKASFSNFGTWVDTFAPGVDIHTTYLNNTYAIGSGTSLSSSLVAGIAALIWSLNPDLTTSTVKKILYTAMKPIDNPLGESVAGGRINAYHSLQLTSLSLILSRFYSHCPQGYPGQGELDTLTVELINNEGIRNQVINNPALGQLLLEPGSGGEAFMRVLFQSVLNRDPDERNFCQ